MNICGIDYGSNLAGTTVICIADDTSMKVHFTAAEKKKSADSFLMQVLQQLKPVTVFIDAPLSLPGVYRFSQGYSDYFFRLCDRQLQAMSPMFLGGLTARAIQLKAALQTIDVPVYETYPGAQAKRMNLYHYSYKKHKENISAVAGLVHAIYPELKIPIPDITSWHHLDSLLALVAGMRFISGMHAVYGDEQEGVIVI